MEFQKPDQNWDKKVQVIKDKGPVDIGTAPTSSPVPDDVKDQFATQGLAENLKITDMGQEFYRIEF